MTREGTPFLNPHAIKSRRLQMFLAKVLASRYGWPSDPRSLCFVSASLIARTVRHTGNAVLSRVLGMLLAAYSVQFVINGIAAVRASLS